VKRAFSIVLLCAALVVPTTALAQRSIATHTTVAILDVDTLVLAANINRNLLNLQNDSDVDMYCSFGKPAVLHEGILLLSGGVGVLFLDYKFAISSVHCIRTKAVGTQNLLVLEGVQ